MVSLPQELIDAIIDQVQDNTSLKSCAIAASPFLSPCQRRIFRSLHVHRGFSGKNRRRTLRSTSVFFTASPHLASHVRELIIELPDDCAAECGSLQVVLRSVQNIERLVVSGMSALWSNLEPGATSALFASVALPSLNRFHVMGIRGVPSALIAAATSIPVVSFSDVIIGDQDRGEEAHGSSSAPRLRHLILPDSRSGTPSICDFLLHPRTLPYTSHIERLEIRIDSSSGKYDHRLLAACAATLKCLVIDPGALVASINIPHLPHVRRVEIRVFVGHNRQLPSLFPTTLSTLASALPLVEIITLTFVVEPLHPEIAWPDAGPLPILGPSFLNRTDLLHLRQVHCKLVRRNTLHSMDALFGRFVGAMESRMPGLQGTGILTCTLAEPQLRYVERLP
ncbi:hypothetical protein DFH09DRAFT_279036 [Mycena vulgaris]|nr:hypothetical protein DFH09DRAFT_279036 [Mycena vulgaris]